MGLPVSPPDDAHIVCVAGGTGLACGTANC
jgi:hypothetical protein